MFAPEFVQDLLASLDSLEGCVLFWRVRRNTIDLLGIEDRVNAMDEPRFLGARVVAIGCACIAASVRPGWLRLVRSFFGLPVFNLGAFLAAADLPSVIGRLLVRHPPWVFVSALKAGGHQVDRVPAPIRSFARWIERDAKRTGSGLPRFLPGSDAALQHSNNVVGDLLAEVPKGGLSAADVRWVGKWSPPWSLLLPVQLGDRRSPTRALRSQNLIRPTVRRRWRQVTADRSG